MLTGGLIAVAGLAWLAQSPTHSGYALHVLAPTLVVAAGTSVTPGIVRATTPPCSWSPRQAVALSAMISLVLKGAEAPRPQQRDTAKA